MTFLKSLIKIIIKPIETIDIPYCKKISDGFISHVKPIKSTIVNIIVNSKLVKFLSNFMKFFIQKLRRFDKNNQKIQIPR